VPRPWAPTPPGGGAAAPPPHFWENAGSFDGYLRTLILVLPLLFL
jgi:hypothetical protein